MYLDLFVGAQGRWRLKRSCKLYYQYVVINVGYSFPLYSSQDTEQDVIVKFRKSGDVSINAKGNSCQAIGIQTDDTDSVTGEIIIERNGNVGHQGNENDATPASLRVLDQEPPEIAVQVALPFVIFIGELKLVRLALTNFEKSGFP